MTKYGNEQRSGQFFITNGKVAKMLEEAGAPKIESIKTGKFGIFVTYAEPCNLDHAQFDHKDFDYETTEISTGGFVTTRFKNCPKCGERVEVDEIAGM